MKKRYVFGLGAIIAGIASAIGVKLMMDKDYHTVPKVEEKDEDNDRGVAPVTNEEDNNESDNKDNEVQNVKADAINHGYKPIDY